jgi:hypothetical protein
VLPDRGNFSFWQLFIEEKTKKIDEKTKKNK